MPEINLDAVDRENHSVTLINTAHHHALVKANRLLLWLVLALMTAVFIMGWLVLPHYSLTDQTLRSQEAVNVMLQQGGSVSVEIQKLKGQMFGLVSGSIESKLRSLEDEIRRGSVADSLNTIEDIKNDVKVLNSYSQQPTAPASAQDGNANQKVIDELSQLKNLVYLTFVSCSLMIAAVAGIWLRNRYRLPHRPTQRIYWTEEE